MTQKTAQEALLELKSRLDNSEQNYDVVYFIIDHMLKELSQQEEPKYGLNPAAQVQERKPIMSTPPCEHKTKHTEIMEGQKTSNRLSEFDNPTYEVCRFIETICADCGLLLKTVEVKLLEAQPIETAPKK